MSFEKIKTMEVLNHVRKGLTVGAETTQKFAEHPNPSIKLAIRWNGENMDVRTNKEGVGEFIRALQDLIVKLVEG